MPTLLSFSLLYIWLIQLLLMYCKDLIIFYCRANCMHLLQLTNWVKCFITWIVDSQKLMTPKQGHTIMIIVRTRETAIPQKVLNSRQTCYPNPLSVDPNICTCSPPLKVSSLKLLYHCQLPLDERHLKV